MSIYVYIGLFAIGAIVGFGTAWQIQSWRSDAAKLEQANKDNQTLNDAIKKQQKQFDDYLAQAKKNQDQATELLQKQMDLQAQATNQNAVIQKQIESIKNVAKTLVPTNVKFDTAHQQLLDSISKTANSAVTGTATSTSNSVSAKPNTAVPAVKN